MESISEPPVAVRGSAVAALASVFFSPTRCFQEIQRGASWIGAFLVTVVLSIVAGVLQRPFTEALVRARIDRLPEAQREAAQRGIGLQTSLQLVFAPIGVALALLLGSAVFFGVSRLMGLQLRFKQVFTGFCYSSLVTSVGGLLYAVLNRHRAVAGEIAGMADMPRMGLDLLGGDGFLRGLLSSVNPFTIWWLVVLVYGVAVLTGRAPRQVATPVVVAGLVWTLITGAFAGLGFAFGER